MPANMMELTVPKSVLGNHTNREYKVVVVGHRAVGKSALVVRFLTKRFISEYLENSEMTCNGVVDVDGEKLQLNIQDTSEKGVRIPAVDHHFRWADAIMLVYSITDKTSYQRLRNAATRLKEKVVEHENADAKIPAIVIVGNKGDLEHVRQVPKHDGVKLANDIGCRFFEASASEGWSKLFNVALSDASKDIVPGKRHHAMPRPSTLALRNTTSNQVRRRSDPSIVVNFISGSKVVETLSPDCNNNGKSVKRNCPPLVSIPVIPQISVSPSECTGSESPKNSSSKGRSLMQKLSPRFSRKFSGSKTPTPKNLSRIGNSLAQAGSAAFVLGNSANVKSQTLPTNLRQSLPPNLRKSPTSRLRTIRDSGKRDAMLWETNSNSSSSSESLILKKEKNGLIPSLLSPDFILGTDTDGTATPLSSEDECTGFSDTTITNAPSRLGVPDLRIRRSRSISKNLNMLELERNRQYNSDSDTSKTKRYESEHKTMTLLSRMVATNQTIAILPNGIGPDKPQTPLVSDLVLYEKKFNSSEPFKFLCREAKASRRMRDKKTPSQMLRDGIRRIRSFANADQGQHNHGHMKQTNLQVTAVRH